MNNILHCATELDKIIWEKYYPSNVNDEEIPLEMALTYLRSDIKKILYDFPDAKDNICSIIKDSEYGNEILTKYFNQITFSKIETCNEIKKNFEIYLNNTKLKDISEIASEIEYQLSLKDLSELAKLYKSNKYKKKIESLLTTCNYHDVCSCFMKGNCINYLNDFL